MNSIFKKIKNYTIVSGVFFLGSAFIIPNTSNLSSTLYKELIAVLGLLILLTVKSFDYKKILIPKNFYWFLFVIFIIFIQLIVGEIYFFQDFFFAISFLVILFLSFLLGFNERLNGDDLIVKKIAWIFIIVVQISFLIAINQKIEIVQNFFLFSSSYNGRSTANLGQPNQFSTLILITFFLLCYLREKNSLNNMVFNILSFCLIFANVMTQSRSAWISVILISLLYLLKFQKKIELRRVIFFNIVFWTLVYCVPLLFNLIFFQKNSYSTFDRLTMGSSRFEIWPQLLKAVFHKPFIGYGWGQTGVAQLETINKSSTKGEWFTYSHNLFLDLMLWNGFFIGLIISILILCFLIELYSSIKNKSDLFLFFCVVAFFVHCLLEYPFAYTYFLIPVGFLCGYISTENIKNSISYFNLSKRKLTLFLGCCWLGYVAFWVEVLDISKKNEIYARQFIFSNHVKFYNRENYILDGFSKQLDFQYLDYCELKDKYQPLDFKKVAYRYPNASIVYKYYSISAEMKMDQKSANQIIRAYSVIKNQKIIKPKLKFCSIEY